MASSNRGFRGLVIALLVFVLIVLLTSKRCLAYPTHWPQFGVTSCPTFDKIRAVMRVM
jgi:hypothetical protein